MKNINTLKHIKSKINLIRFLFLIGIHILQVVTPVNAQSIPRPLYEFPLDADNPEQWNNYSSKGALLTHQGVKGGLLTAHTDRFGNPKGAVNFGSSSYVALYNLPPTSAGEDMTVSFWIYMDKTHPTPATYYPSSQKYRFFTLSTDAKSGGLARVAGKAQIGVERTVNVNGMSKSWYLWLYEPAVMTQKGWYHIIMVSAKNYTKMYLFNPDGTKSCSYNYMGNNFPKKLTIGKRFAYTGQNVRSGKVMDDFKVYGQALEQHHADKLHNIQTPFKSACIYYKPYFVKG